MQELTLKSIFSIFVLFTICMLEFNFCSMINYYNTLYLGVLQLM